MVEWKKLGEVASYYRGVTYNKKQEVPSGGTKILRANNITVNTNKLNFDDVKEISSSVKIKDYQWLYTNDILICAGSGSKEHIGKVAYIDKDINYAYGGFMGKLVSSASLNPRYFFHYMSSRLFKEYLDVALNSTTINNLNSSILNDFLIPIPSFQEQERIVGILDTFTASIDNLKEQIAQRRKQYDWFLDKLYYSNKEELLKLKKNGKLEVKTLDEIGTFTRGRRFVRTDIVPEGVPCIHYGDMYTYYGVWADKTPTYLTKEVADKLRFAQKGDVVIVAAGENDLDIGVGVAWLGEEDVVVHDACFIFHHQQNAKYLSYFFRSNNYHQQIRMGVVDGKICSISAKELGRTFIPVPPLSEQQRIVSMLDTFEASIGNLEAQLAERQKQYEYYRNRLLTFD